MAGSDSRRLCVKCKKIIQNTEAVLVCGLWCRKSFHKECLGLSNSDARAVTSSELLFKFHCEACEKRLGTELCGEKEPEQPKNVGKCVNNCVNLLDLVEKLVKLTTEVSNDNSAINSKLDIVLRTNAKLEEYLLQSPKGFEIRSEDTRDNSVVRVESDSPKRITEIREQYDGTNVSTQNINCDQMRWCASEIKRIGRDFPNQSIDSQHPCQQQNTAEDCSPNCQQGREEPDGHNSSKESRSIVKEECPHPEDVEVICTVSAEKSEDEEDEQGAVIEAGMKRHSASEAFVGPSKFRTEDSADDDDDDEAEDAVRDEFEACPHPEDIGVICTLIEEKSEDEEDEQRAVFEAGIKVKQEMEYTTSGSEQESPIPVVIGGSESGNDGNGLVPNISPAEKRERSVQHSTQLDAEACGNKPDRRDTEHRCFICKKMFAELQELQDHFHVHSGTAILSCSVCHKTFKTKSNLKEHFRCHTGERPYRCTICNKTFSYNSSLKQHLMVHSDDSPYKCSLCNKEFRLSLSLKQHMKLHTGECPYKCSICSKAFIRSSNLKQHLRVHTGERPYRCSICNKGYTLFSSMHRHFRKHSR